jgi:hypothetical protein
MTHSIPLPKGRFLAYLRVATPKQGEGVSLLTQREEIAKFAARRGLVIPGWFEEKEMRPREAVLGGIAELSRGADA